MYMYIKIDALFYFHVESFTNHSQNFKKKLETHDKSCQSKIENWPLLNLMIPL